MRRGKGGGGKRGEERGCCVGETRQGCEREREWKRERGLTDTLSAPEIGRGGKGLSLREIEREEGTAAPADHEAGEFGDREREQLPW